MCSQGRRGWVQGGRRKIVVFVYLFLILFPYLFIYFFVVFYVILLFLLIFCFLCFLIFSCFFPIYAREVMSCYIRKFPGEIRSQGWQGGLIATTRDETFWGG